MTKRIACVSFGDNHAGQINGLIRPGTHLTWGVGEQAEKKQYNDEHLSDWSKWLWYDVWMPGIEEAICWAGNDPLMVLHSGDVTHGDKFAGSMVEKNFYSIHANHQEHIAQECLRPLKDAPTLARFVLAFGTNSHDFGANSASENVAMSLNAWGWDTVADDHIDQIIDGFCINLAHHGPYVSKINRNRENTARNYVKERIDDALSWGKRYADFYQRGHVHMPVSTGIRYKKGPTEHRSHIIITPPLCGPNGYARQATRSMERVECGLYMWDILDGKLNDVVPFLREKSTRKTYMLQYNQIKPKKKKKKKGKRK